MNKLTIVVLYAGTWFASAGEISDYYFKHSRENTNWVQRYAASVQKSRSHEQVESTNHGITEIGIERTACYGTCPVYTFIASSDGTFRYKGDKHVERTGKFSGTIPIWQFHALSQFIRDSGYMGFEDQYRRAVTDHSTTFTTVVMDGKRKVVNNYANAGPTTLWAIEQLIDDLMAKAEWKPGLPKAPEPTMPKVTRYDNDPVLRAVYLDSFRKAYFDAWEGKYELPVFAPTSDADKARVLAYAEGLDAGRAARATWFGTNSQPVGPTSPASMKR